jgi:microcystin-dependent protein
MLISGAISFHISKLQEIFLVTVLMSPAVPTGSVHMFAMAAVPSGYLVCEGQNVSRTTYADLFSAIGTTFGAGDGSSTFALPDLRNEFIRGADPSGGRAIGATEADATAVNGLGLTDPGHTHGVNTTGVGGYNASQLPRGYSTVFGTATTNSNTTGITLSSTDTETRPQNVALLYAIKT